MTVKIHTYTHIFNFFVQELNECEQKLLKSTKKFNYKVSYFKNANSNGGSPLYLCKCVFYIL